MTVAELVAELQKLPQDVPVRIEGYFPGTLDDVGIAAGAAFIPNHVETLQNELTGVYAVVWAQGVTEIES